MKNDTNDRQYYLARASEERQAAETASDPRASAAHDELAEKYEELASQSEAKKRPILRIAVPMLNAQA